MFLILDYILSNLMFKYFSSISNQSVYVLTSAHVRNLSRIQALRSCMTFLIWLYSKIFSKAQFHSHLKLAWKHVELFYKLTQAMPNFSPTKENHLVHLHLDIHLSASHNMESINISQLTQLATLFLLALVLMTLLIMDIVKVEAQRKKKPRKQ